MFDEAGAGPVTITRPDGTTDTQPAYTLPELNAITKRSWRSHIFGTPDADSHEHGVAQRAGCTADGCHREVSWSSADRLYCSDRCRRRTGKQRRSAREGQA